MTAWLIARRSTIACTPSARVCRQRDVGIGSRAEPSRGLADSGNCLIVDLDDRHGGAERGLNGGARGRGMRASAPGTGYEAETTPSPVGLASVMELASVSIGAPARSVTSPACRRYSRS